MQLLRLRAGPLAMAFDPVCVFLRHIRLGDREIVRGIYGAVRDRNWDTVPIGVHQLTVDDSGDRFRIGFDAECRTGEIHFVWRGEIVGAADGAVRFLFDGVAKTSFLKNRIGLCVLHPVRECAGQACRVRHVDGTASSGVFPRFISPHQPFKYLQAISHEVEAGLTAEVSFEGEAFEMEDQRNWTDASFKTYSTPLELPFPVRVEAGARVRHAVTLQLHGDAPRTASAPAGTQAAAPRVRVDWSGASPLPPIGLGTATTGQPLTAAARAALAQLRPAHLRVDLPLAASGWQERWWNAAELAEQLQAGLHAALFVSDAAEQELEAVLDVLDEATRRPPIALWLAIHTGEKATSPRWAELAGRVLGRLGPQIPLAAGTNAYFAELNRHRPPAGSPALPCYSLNPQVHAFDNLSLVETLGAQRSTVESTQQFCPRPVVISPVTLRPRFNPNATESSADASPESDPRQSTGFGAAWTLGALARLATCPDVHSLTFYETAGPRGVMDSAGRPFPMFHVFAALAGCDTVGQCVSSQPLLADALALSAPDGRRRILLAGFAAAARTVVLENIAGTIAIRRLSPAGFQAAETLTTADGTLGVEVPGESVVLLDWS